MAGVLVGFGVKPTVVAVIAMTVSLGRAGMFEQDVCVMRNAMIMQAVLYIMYVFLCAKVIATNLKVEIGVFLPFDWRGWRVMNFPNSFVLRKMTAASICARNARLHVDNLPAGQCKRNR